MFKSIDRYLWREMTFPFFAAVFGFIIYIILSFVLQLFQYFSGRDLPLDKVFLMLLYRLPELAVYALAIAMLFSVFLAIGRLVHDHEMIAFQGAGYSLRRITLPFLFAGLVVSLVAFSVSEFWTPKATHRYYVLLRELQLSPIMPTIHQDIFFKGPDERTFYIRDYDYKTKRMSNILIIDGSGEPALINRPESPFPKTITAKEGYWERLTWTLTEGVIHEFNQEGQLEHVSTFQKLTVQIGLTFDESFIEQLTPAEMSMPEIAERIKTLQEKGLPAAGLVVEYHSRMAIPLAAFIFALFAAPLSLIFGQAGAPRGRAVGIILGILLAALSQGALLWGQILGRQETIPPALGPWLPDILFGLIGLLLLLWMDQLSRIDLWQRAKRLVHRSVFLTLVLVFWPCSIPIQAQEIRGLDLKADTLSVTRDWSYISAEGHVQIAFDKGSIQAEKVSAKRLSSNVFEVQASGPIAFKGEGMSAESQQITAQLQLVDDRWTLHEAKLFGAVLMHDSGTLEAMEIMLAQQKEGWQVTAAGNVSFTEKARVTTAEKLILTLLPDAEKKIIADSAWLEHFSGESKFINAEGEEHTIRFEGESAQAYFQNNEMKQLDILKGGVTTCTCDAPIPSAAYSLQAEKFWLYIDQYVVATNIVIKVYGFPIFWTPLYLAPLKEIQKSPLLPEIGQSPTRGWFARWRVPFFLNKNNHGFLSLDYYSKKPEIGTGVDFNYLFPANRGHINVYRLAGYGESYSIDWNHHLDLPLSTALTIAANSRTGQLEKDIKKTYAQATLSGNFLGWRWSVSGSRDDYRVKPEDDEETPEDEKIRYSVLGKLPEFSLSNSLQTLLGLPFNLSLALNYGRYREKKFGSDTFSESSRLDNAIGLRLSPWSLGIMSFQAGSNYRLSFYGENMKRESWEISLGMNLRPIEILTLSADYLFRQVAGGSPFTFDRLSVFNKISLRANAKIKEVSTSLNTGYDFFAARFDLLRFSLNQQTKPFTFAFDAQYDIQQQKMQLVTLRTSYAQEKSWSLVLQTGFRFESQKFDDLIAKFSMEKFRLSSSMDLNKLQLKRVNAETDFSLGEKWELSLDGEYDFISNYFSTWQIGIVHKFCHNCWQLGFYSNGDQIWLQARVTAFPMAEIEYSPTDQELSFGGK